MTRRTSIRTPYRAHIVVTGMLFTLYLRVVVSYLTCSPGLNVMANYGFISRDGVSSFDELVAAQQNMYNVGVHHSDLRVRLAHGAIHSLVTISPLSSRPQALVWTVISAPSSCPLAATLHAPELLQRASMLMERACIGK